MLAAVVFAVTLVLVALNAYQRDMVNHDLSLGNRQGNPADGLGGSIGAAMAPQQSPNWGPGATQAAEMSFPAKSPTQHGLMYYTAAPHQQYAMVPMQSIRPSEPTMQIMAVPFDNGKGAVVHRLKRVVGR